MRTRGKDHATSTGNHLTANILASFHPLNPARKQIASVTANDKSIVSQVYQREICRWRPQPGQINGDVARNCLFGKTAAQNGHLMVGRGID